MQSASHVNIRRMLLSHYTTDQLSDAKMVLWDAADRAVIGDYQSRRGSNNRSKCEREVDDLIDAMIKLDEADRMPEITMSAKDIALIPSFHPEESNNVYMVERLNALEKRLDDLHHRVMTPAFSEVVSRGTPKSATSAPPAASGLQNRTEMHDSTGPIAGTRSEAEATPAAAPTNGQPLNKDASSWTKVKGKRWRKKQKMLRTAAQGVSSVVGEGGSDTEIKARPGLERIFIHNLDRECDKMMLERFLHKKQVKVIDVRKTSREDWLSASFKVVIDAKDKAKTLMTDFWPPGVHCREWITVKKAKSTPRSKEKPPGNGDAASDDAGDAFVDAADPPEDQDGDSSQ